MSVIHRPFPLLPLPLDFFFQGLKEDSPAYEVMRANGLLTTKYRRESVEDIFTGLDIKANTTHMGNIKVRNQTTWRSGRRLLSPHPAHARPAPFIKTVKLSPLRPFFVSTVFGIWVFSHDALTECTAVRSSEPASTAGPTRSFSCPPVTWGS